MNIKEKREAIGMTQSQLAVTARVPQPNISAYENGRRTPSPEVLERITDALKVRPSVLVKRFRSEIESIVAKHHATSPRIVGSVARGSDTAESDLDLLVTFTSEASFLDEVSLQVELEKLLNIKVDVIGDDTLRGNFKDRVTKEAVPL